MFPAILKTSIRGSHHNTRRMDSPLGWLSRDHRKSLVVDGQIGFIAGLCVGNAWIGDRAKKIDPWRDTGVEIQGKAVAEIERAFADIWARMGQAIPESEPATEPVAAVRQAFVLWRRSR
jgi:cardiolipin synthase